MNANRHTLIVQLAAWTAVAAGLQIASGENLTTTRPLIQVEAPSFEPARTNTISVVLTAEGNENAAGFTLRYDPIELRFMGAVLGKDSGAALLQLNASEVGRGLLGVAVALPVGTAWKAGRQTLVEIAFAAAGNGGVNTSILLTDDLIRRQLVTLDARTVAAQYQGAAVQIGEPELPPAVLLSGRVRYYAGLKALSGVELGVAGGVSLRRRSDLDGAFEFEVPSGGSYRLSARMDASVGDRRGVTTSDIAVIRRHLLGVERISSPYQLIAADVDGSGSVTDADLEVLREWILGLRESMPGGVWRFVSSDFGFQDSAEPWGFEESRHYPVAVADAMEQDFIAIKVGDANGSW